MFELSQPIASAIVVVIGLLLYVLAWRSVGGLPGWLKWTLRLLLVAVVLLPFTVIAILPMQKSARAPMESRRVEAPAPASDTLQREAAEQSVAAERMRREQEAARQRLEQERQAAERARAVEEAQRNASDARERVERQMAEVERKLRQAEADGAVSSKKSAQAGEGADDAPAEPPKPGRNYKYSMPPGADEPQGSAVAVPTSPGASDGFGGLGGLGRSSGSGGGTASGPRAPMTTEREVDRAAVPESEPPANAGSEPPAAAAGGESAAPVGGTRGLTPTKPRAPIVAAPRSTDAMPSAPAPDSAVAPVPPPAPVASAPAPVASAGEDKSDWTVVPVFFGTDREKQANDKRLEYGSSRGRKLDLGRALVTVPKLHQVPQVERPWAITIPYFRYKVYEQKEDPKSHFTMQELKNLTEAEMIDLVKQRLATSARFKDHAFVFIHGYNTSFDYAVYRAAQVAYDIKFDGAPFVYSWPSGGGIGSYTYDRESAAQAEPFLEEFLKIVTQKTGAKTISLIAHSMGNQLLLRVLQDLNRSKPEGVKISQIILAAPDVDRDGFENIAGRLKDMASGGITLYASSNDRALDVSRRFNGGIPRAGDVPGGVPLVVPGVDTIDATAVSMDSLGLHHSGYAESNTLLNDIGLLIQTGERPPEKRVPILQKVETSKGSFWRYP
jgi:esterase/lipase superfamily enzyme